jgi:hypothetical protein
MRRASIAFLLFPATLFAQTAAPPATMRLPVTHVSLYKNGVGFFEHTGSISGDAKVTVDFTDAQLDDVLQTLTAIDRNGGRIAGADYNSTTPLAQQLKTLGLGLDEHTDYESLLTALHGARVTVTGSGAPLTGRIVDIEAHTTGDGSDTNPSNTRAEYFLNVASDAGDIRLFKVTPALSVHLLDAATHTDLNQYLQLLDSTRSHGLRHLTLEDRGAGPRTLQLSYLSEVPIWKSTYRILFTDRNKSGAPHLDPEMSDTATLQGWSVVDNTTGTDWINVKLSLIAGAPQSFLQPLSQPIYSRRPEIPIAQEAQLTPQTFDSGMEPQAKQVDHLDTFTNINAIVSSNRSVGGIAGGAPGGVIGGTAAGSGYGLGIGGNTGGGVMRSTGAPMISYQDAAVASTSIAAATAAFDDYFSYNLTEPVTIRKNESALVPILQVKVPADRVTLVSSNGYTASQPLRALWITNSSNLTLDRGSFSLVEDGNFGGEGLLDPIHPGEKRLLSYAADQAVHVSIEGNTSSTHVSFLRGSKGVLNIHHAELHEITFVVHNAAAEARTVVIEEPVVRGFVLDSAIPGSPSSGTPDPKPVETTATVYRFRVTVPAGGTVRLHSGAKRNGYTTYFLTRSDDNQFKLIVDQADQNPALIAALQPILDARRKVADAQTAVDQTNKRLTDLRSDEDRQRANITALATADKSSRDRFVHDLNATEDAIAAAQKELGTQTTALDAAKADLATKIEAFHINTKDGGASGSPENGDTEP